MGNGYVNPYVPEVHLNDDDTVALVVQLVGFNSGSWADISGYITQGNNVFAPFSALQAIPDPVGGISSLTVSVPKIGLVPGGEVNVITRVTEVKLWPTALAEAKAAPGVKASWQAKGGSSGPLAPRADPQGGYTQPTGPGQVTATGDSSLAIEDLQKGIKFVITIQAQPAG